MMRPCALGGRVEFGVPGILLTAKREESGNGDRLHEKLQWRHIVFMRYNTSKKAYSGVLLMKGLWQWLASCKTVSGDKVYVFRWDNRLHHLVCKNTHEVGAGWCRTINPAITSTCSNLLVTPCFCSLKISHMSNFHGKFYMNPDWNVYPQSSPGSITFFFTSVTNHGILHTCTYSGWQEWLHMEWGIPKKTPACWMLHSMMYLYDQPDLGFPRRPWPKEIFKQLLKVYSKNYHHIIVVYLASY